MKRLRWQLLIIFLTGLVVGILLLGEQPQTLVSPVAEVSPEPVKGGIYTEALVGSLARLNPLLSFNNAPDRDINRLIFSGLLRFDGKGIPQVDLAEKMGVSMDGTLYNFTLRKGALWHDGAPVRADDVLFTVELMRAGGGAVPPDLQDFWKEVELVKLSDDSIQFRLPEAFAPFPDYLTFGILPKHILGSLTLDGMIDSSFNLAPVGTGPYRFGGLLVDNGSIQGVSLLANENYYGSRPYIQQIVFRYYPDSASALQAYRDDQVQGIGLISPDVLKEALAEPDLGVYTARQPLLSMVMFNLKNQDVPFLQEVKVRKALMKGLNRQLIVDRILQGQAAIANGPILPGTWAHYEELQVDAYDPDAAQTLLKEAGFILAAEGDVVRQNNQEVSLTFTLVHPDDAQHTAVAEFLRASWARLGVLVQLEPVPYDALIRDYLEQRDYQAALVDLNLSRSPDPDPYPFWDQAQSVNGQNYTQWESRIASEYIEQARISANVLDRARLYRSFQVIFARELPALPLYYPMYSYAVDRNVLGVRAGPLFDSSDRFGSIGEWFLASEQLKPQNANPPANQEGK